MQEQDDRKMEFHFDDSTKYLIPFYKEHLTNILLPFWMRSLDANRGGIYTCYNNYGTILVSRDKYTWSQGRFIWIWSRIAKLCQKGQLKQSSEPFLEQARKTVDFLWNHVILSNGNCAYVLTDEGKPKEEIQGQGYDISFYADCFVILGFTEYAKLTRDVVVLERALLLYNHLAERVRANKLRSEPYPIAEGTKSHSVSMILLNVTQELYHALQLNQHPRTSEFSILCENHVYDIMEVFRQKDSRIAEILPLSDDDLADTILCRHMNPGHTIESMWFVLHAANQLNQSKWIKPAIECIKKAFELGWDPIHGGLLRFVDLEGGKPKGRLIGDRYEQLILDTWDTKLWWPHSELLYATLLSYYLTGDQSFLKIYQQAHEYVFNTFPNPDFTVGEWVQIRDRTGNPLEKQVALPVKDPYHIIRNVLLIIELLEGGCVQV